MACPDLAAETTFFATLENMTLSEASGDTLILSNPDGRQMVFVAR
jgi:heat shock protein HslJ